MATLLAGFVIARGRRRRGGRLHRAHFAPGLVAAPLGNGRLDAQQRMLESLLLRETAGRKQREHAIGVGRAIGREERAGGAQQEFGAVGAGGAFRRQPFVHGGRGGMIARARERLGTVDARWPAAARRRGTSRQQQRRGDEERQREMAVQSFLMRHASNSLRVSERGGEV